MPTECYLKNDLDVEFISKLAKEKIDTKTKGLVQYMIFDQFCPTESFHMTYKGSEQIKYPGLFSPL